MHVDKLLSVQYLACLSMIGIMFVLLLFPSGLDIAEAVSNQGLNKSIGIAYSKTCKIMIENNFTHNCPMPKDLYTLDTSNQKISGGFIFEGDWIEREEPPIENHFRFYDYENDWNIFFEPPGDMRERIRMIYIENNFEKYFLPSKSFLLNNGTLSYGLDRYADSSCRNITIGTNNFNVLFPDTLQYVRSGCDENKTYYDTLFKVHYEKSFQDITTSQKYKDEKRLEYILENCIKEYGKCD